MTQPDLRELHVWIVQARKRFDLRRGRKDQATEYWRGYAACLEDLERFASGPRSADVQGEGVPVAHAAAPEGESVNGTPDASPSTSQGMSSGEVMPGGDA